MVKINYDSIPTQHEALIKERVDKVSTLFPNWCRQVTVYYDAFSSMLAYVVPDSTYRHVTLYLTGHFITDENWYSTLIHELLHVYLRPYDTKVENLIDQQPEMLRNFLKEEFRVAEEQIVTDLTDLLERCNNESWS